ncbi:MAG TPA: RidA family protein [Blastocatellia bacterium]|nr:RidA family protein [Blastocatellia bacterium]
MRGIKPLAGITTIILVFAIAADAQKKSPPAQPAKAQRAMVEYESASNTSARTLSDFVRVGDIVYLSGKLGTDSTGKLAEGGIGPETKQAMENIKASLEKAGSSMDNVVKCTVMLADIKEWAAMNAVYTTFFKKERLPARSAFGTSGLVRDARVEIECMATLK